MQKRLLLLVAFALMVLNAITAQMMLGYHTSNYAGIHNIYFQPADIVDGRHVLDINLIGNSYKVGGNYIGMKSSALFEPSRAFNDTAFQRNYLVERINGKDKAVMFHEQLYLPSVAFSWGKNAVAFSARLNVSANVEGVNEQLATTVYDQIKDPTTWNIPIKNKDFSIQTMTWADYGFTYGREVFRAGNHYVKAAATARLLQGFVAAQMYSSNLDVSFTNDDTLNIVNSEVNYAHTIQPEDINGVGAFTHWGFGMDFGVVYEWRKDPSTYTYEMDGRDDWERHDLNKYKLKLGFSAMDLGGIGFRKGIGSGGITANASGIPINDFSVDSLAAFDSVLTSRFNVRSDVGNKFRMRLPATLNFTADYNIWKGFYANATLTLAPRFRKDANKIRTVTQFSVTPRFETKLFGAYLPVSYDGLGNFHVGLGLRFAPFVIGIQDFTPFISKKKVIYDSNMYIALRIPIYYGRGKRDRDGDKVSNRMDNCKKEKGTWENKGCPSDRDKDGVIDENDDCPDVAGKVELKGCPDKDGDGIIDSKDACPEKPGKPENDGCPDTDGDGIFDNKDRCVTEAGVAELQGCPYRDEDKDGVKDNEDKCPNEAGVPELGGCPYGDKDKDGFKDNVDKCPDVPGVAELQGCPYGDKDNDGFKDNVDKCPDVPGVAELQGCPYGDKDNDAVKDNVDKCPDVPGTVKNNGCPELSKKEEDVMQTAFDNLVFKISSDEIASSSFKSLTALADLLAQKNNYKLLVEGHTDNQGTDAANLTLSEKRAMAVKTYLVKKGIDAARITTKGYGETVPIADNKTAEGRAKNRRVVMTVTQ